MGVIYNYFLNRLSIINCVLKQQYSFTLKVSISRVV